jgi:hypothetical protein
MLHGCCCYSLSTSANNPDRIVLQAKASDGKGFSGMQRQGAMADFVVGNCCLPIASGGGPTVLQSPLAALASPGQLLAQVVIEAGMQVPPILQHCGEEPTQCGDHPARLPPTEQGGLNNKPLLAAGLLTYLSLGAESSTERY